jgi:hypothetical protein
MSRLSDFGRDTAYYFGVSEGSDPRRDPEQEEATWLSTAVGIVPVLLAALVLRRVLGLDDDFAGFVATLGLAVALGAVWGLVLRLISGRRVHAPRRDG